MPKEEGAGQLRFCRDCGAKIRPGNEFCTSCGAPLTPETKASKNMHAEFAPEDEGERETVLQILQAECEVLLGRPEDYFPH